MVTKVQREKFLELDCRLSPENLCCDGEISHTEVRRRYATIKREWKTLEKECGERVSQDRVESWYMKEIV